MEDGPSSSSRAPGAASPWLIPDGEYQALVADARLRVSESRGGRVVHLEVAFLLQSPPYEGRTLKRGYPLRWGDSGSVDFSNPDLFRLREALGQAQTSPGLPGCCTGVDHFACASR